MVGYLWCTPRSIPEDLIPCYCTAHTYTVLTFDTRHRGHFSPHHPHHYYFEQYTERDNMHQKHKDRIAKLIASDLLTHDEIADAMHVSVKDVEDYVYSTEGRRAINYALAIPADDHISAHHSALASLAEDRSVPPLIRFAAAREGLARLGAGPIPDELLERLRWLEAREAVDWGRYTQDEQDTLIRLFRKGFKDPPPKPLSPDDILWGYGLRRHNEDHDR